jgi:hypothetical protein
LASEGEGKGLRILGWIFISKASIKKKVLIIDGGLRFCQKFEGKFERSA